MISADDVKLIQKKFSSAAERYDRLAFIQNDVRGELLAKVVFPPGGAILDVGCGTGVLLGELAQRNPSGMNIGMDLAWGMTRHAKAGTQGGIFLQGDGGMLPFKRETFDLVVSASSYQWTADIGSAFLSAHRVLKSGGNFRAALFGQETLFEFFESLRMTLDASREKILQIERLPSHGDIRRALEGAGFKDAALFSEKRQAVFRDLWSLLVWLKSVGSNNLGRGVFLGKKALAETQACYANRFGVEGGLRVTFEVIWVDARK